MSFRCSIAVDINKQDIYRFTAFSYEDAKREVDNYLLWKKSKHPSILTIEWIIGE